MPFSADLLYQVYQQERNNPAYAGMDDNAFAAQFLDNAVNNFRVDGGTLTQLAQMVNPGFYAQNADYASAAASGNFNTPQWQNLNNFSNNARAAADAADGMIGNNVPTQGGTMSVTGSGPSATVSANTGAGSGWQYAQGTPAPRGVPLPTGLDSRLNTQLGASGQFDPMSMIQQRQAPTGSAQLPIQALQAQAPGQFQMPQAPQLPQFQGSPLNIQSPNAPQLPQMPNIPGLNMAMPNAPQAMMAQAPGLSFDRPNAPTLPSGGLGSLDVQLPGAPSMRTANAQPLSFNAPNAPGLPGDLNAPSLPGALDGPSASLNRPQGPQSVMGSMQAPTLSAIQGPQGGINRPQGPAGVSDPSLAGYSRNPGMDQALDTLQRRIGTMRDEGLQSVRSNAVAVGGLGGSRQGVAERGVIEDANNTFADAAGQLLYQDYGDTLNRNLQRYQADQGFALGKGQLGQQQFGTEADLAAADATLRNQNFNTQVQQNLGLSGIGADLYKSDQANAIDRTGLNLQRYGIDADLAATEGNLGLQRFNTLVNQNLGLGGLANDRLGTMASYDINRAGLGQQQYQSQLQYDLGRAGATNDRYGLDLQSAANQNAFGLGAYQTGMQGALGAAGLQNDRAGLQTQRDLGIGGLATQQYGQALDYDLGRANAMNQRYSTDVANTANQNQYNANIFGTQTQGALGMAGAQNDRYGLQTNAALGLGGLANQQYGTQANFALGAGGLQNQRYGQDQSYALGLGGLGQSAYQTGMQGALGQQQNATNRYLGELGFNNNMANTQVAADRARNDFFTAQRGQDYQGQALGASLLKAQQDYEWAPVQNAANIYAGFGGLGSQVNSGSGGGWQGLLGGALTGASLGKQLGWWGS